MYENSRSCRNVPCNSFSAYRTGYIPDTTCIYYFCLFWWQQKQHTEWKRKGIAALCPSLYYYTCHHHILWWLTIVRIIYYYHFCNHHCTDVMALHCIVLAPILLTVDAHSSKANNSVPTRANRTKRMKLRRTQCNQKRMPTTLEQKTCECTSMLNGLWLWRII